jgi:putative oxidoreductase
MTAGLPSWGTALLRVMLGVIYVAHGYLGYAVVTVPELAGYVTRMGYPLLISELLGWYLVLAHLLGGGLILVGLWTRAAALAQVPIMASAVFLLHGPQGFFVRGMTIDTPQGQQVIAAGYEFALLVLVATIALILLGPGAMAVDGVRRRGRRA